MLGHQKKSQITYAFITKNSRQITGVAILSFRIIQVSMVIIHKSNKVHAFRTDFVFPWWWYLNNIYLYTLCSLIFVVQWWSHRSPLFLSFFSMLTLKRENNVNVCIWVIHYFIYYITNIVYYYYYYFWNCTLKFLFFLLLFMMKLRR